MDRHEKQARLSEYLRKIAPSKDEQEGVRSRMHEMPGDLGEGPMRGASYEAAHEAMDGQARGHELSESQLLSLEAIVLPRERPVVDVENDTFKRPESPWERYFDDSAIKHRIEAAIPSIGRVELPDNRLVPYGGTAFVVGKGLLMTNRHVAEQFASGKGTRDLAFLDGQSAKWDPKREKDPMRRPDIEPLHIQRVVMIHPYWDMALIEVVGLSAERKPLELSVVPPQEQADRDIAVVGYPAMDSRNDAALQQRIFRSLFNVKRMQPGKIRARDTVWSFGNQVSAMTHDASTLGGNSGSAIIDVETGQIIGLHFAGLYLKDNYAVPLYELARDPRVINLGLNFKGPIPHPNGDLGRFWSGFGPLEHRPTPHRDASAADGARTLSGRSSVPVRVQIGEQAMSFSVDLPIPPRGSTCGYRANRAESPLAEMLERAMQKPKIAPHLDEREGYDPDFLELDDGLLVPLPALTEEGRKVVGRLEDGSSELKYHKFSIVMHKVRRLALFTAANVDWRDEVRTINGKRPTRSELSGIPKATAEEWVTDDRIPERHQLPDVFFTKDGTAFDKGHLVRRDDICWGTSLRDIRKGNGDTYHTTNCSPQVAGFNQSSKGEDNWGDLENLVQREAGAERVCIISGPVLDRHDLRFEGVDLRGEVSIQIPSSYWKIIVAAGDAGPEAYGFVLEQDLADVPLEFAVPKEWRRYMRSIKDIEKMLFGLATLEPFKKWDQFEGRQGGSRRKKR